MSAFCPFCAPDAARLIFEHELAYGLWDGYPVSPGHALLIPRRHVATWFDASDEEHRALTAAIDEARRRVLDRFADRPPDGFNIGVNAGLSAGQTVMHLHVHLIPRWTGDVPNPRGGVRHLMPGKGHYDPSVAPEVPATGPVDPAAVARDRASAPPPPAVTDLAPLPHPRALIVGEGDRLIDHLRVHMARTPRMDLAVAFVQRSGLELIRPYLEELLSRDHSHVRLVAGDYLDVTDPDALARLHDLALGARAGALAIRIFETGGVRSFHPKAYVFHAAGGADAVALVGSSNLSHSALTDAVEWNFRVVSSRDAAGFATVARAFDELFAHPATVPLTEEWVDRYRARRRLALASPRRAVAAGLDDAAPLEAPEPPPTPTREQVEALAALEATREAGFKAGLVVMATGLGKTWLAAFDASRDAFRRVLFVAHREEILRQALKTFRRIRPEARLGLYTGTSKDVDADVLFASVQTLGRPQHLTRFAPDAFDYVVVDEFHHAEAGSYRRVIEHFAPRFLLGLTATPERTDGADLLALCQQNLVYRCDLHEGIGRGRLVPFRYFGVPDEVDYTNIPWRSGRFDEAALDLALATRTRAANALAEWRKHAGPGRRTLGFCASVRHAAFMREFFREHGVRAAAVHSEPGSDARAIALSQLEAGELDILFSVDVFNEGLDVPAIDAVLMLRPTESRIVYLQQLGRGLRRAAGKTHLTVVDYIGNHRSFLLKLRAMLDLDEGSAAIREALQAYRANLLALPPGCEVTYDLEALGILERLANRGATALDQLASFYESYREEHGERPSAVDVLSAGLSLKGAREAHGSWFGLVRAKGDLATEQEAALARGESFLAMLEVTPMTRSFKMVLLRALLSEDALPGELPIERLVGAFRRAADASPRLREDVGAALATDAALRKYLEVNPIAAWVGGKGTGGSAYFGYDGATFRSTFDVPAENRESFQDLVRELVDFRIAQYLQRDGGGADARIVCDVSHSNGRPILRLPNARKGRADIPRDWQRVVVDGEEFEANFVEVAVNVFRRPGATENVLPELMRAWFGPSAGLPGTRHRVAFERRGDHYELVRVEPG